jgi:fatty acid desaturase
MRRQSLRSFLLAAELDIVRRKRRRTGVKGQTVAVWTAVGIGVGVAIGAATHSLAIWICIGAVAGVAIGAALGRPKKSGP